MRLLSFNTSSILPGMACSSFTTCRYVSLFIVPFSLAKAKANMESTVTCPVKAFVDATPISGPTWMYDPVSVARGMLEPMALHIPYINAPFSFASFIAARVSAVSPLCERAITTSFSVITGLR